MQTIVEYVGNKFTNIFSGFAFLPATIKIGTLTGTERNNDKSANYLRLQTAFVILNLSLKSTKHKLHILAVYHFIPIILYTLNFLADRSIFMISFQNQ